VKQLKQAIVLEWGALSQRFTDDSIDQWRLRSASYKRTVYIL